MSWAVLVLVMVGCRDDPEPGTTKDSSTTTYSGPEWARGKPSIDGSDLIPGYTHHLTISGVPEASTVTWLRSDTGPSLPGEGICLDEWQVVCAGITDAEIIGTTPGGAGGDSEFSADVPIGEDARPVWFQGWVLDESTGASIMTSVLQRHIAVPPGEGALTLVIADLTAELGEMRTGGNSHTGGAAWVDVNNDFIPDLFMTNATELPHRLWLNKGDGTFVDWSDRVMKQSMTQESAGVQYADIDNDGDQDILVVVDSHRPMNVAVAQERTGGPNLLYINEGDGTFTESGEAWGIVHPLGHRTSCGAFGDYDRDGLVDLYLCSWAVLSEPYGVYDKYDRLLRNTGSTFVEVPSGPDGYGRDALVATFVDFDHDLWPDLYVGNVAEHDLIPDEDPTDVLYMNASGTFEDRTIGGMGDGFDAWAAMGTALGDIDNDGQWEFYITDHWDYPPEPRGNPLYRVNPDGTLSENICLEADICSGYLTWPANFTDFDQDGYVDLWVGTAWESHNDLLYINQQDGTFDMHAQEDFRDNATHGGSVADYDLDGDQDIFLFSDIGRSHLYRNELHDPKNWMQFRLVGTQSNKSAIGAVIRLTTGGMTQMRMVRGSDSAHSQTSLTTHFGLGEQATATAEVTWPSGTVQVVGPLDANQFYVIDEDTGLRAEELVTGEATLDGNDILTVTVSTNYHGRTKLNAAPMNQSLVYDAERRVHELVIDVSQDPPPTVSVGSDHGSAWDIPVAGP